MLTRAGYVHKEGDVQCTPGKVFTLTYHEIPPTKVWDQDFRWELQLAEGVGYWGFVTMLYFGDDGALVGHGCWE